MKTTRQLFLSAMGLASLFLLTGCSSKSDAYTRGIGLYPGNPDETYAPELVADNTTYRNVAELKSAYHSSSYDYNLTAQLITDGIISSVEPATINVSTQNGDLKKHEREWLFDGKSDSKYVVNGTDVYLQLDLNHFDFSVDKIVLSGSVTLDETKAKGYEIVAYGSNDGTNWDVLAQEKGSGYVGKERPASPWDAFFGKSAGITRILKQEIVLPQPVNYAHYKISLKAPDALTWNFTDWDYYKNDELLVVLPSCHFNSAWKSAGTGEEWVYVDLGASATIDKVKLSWINKALAGTVQTSDDAKSWKDAVSLPGGNAKTDEITLSAKGRYVRVWMTEAENNQPYILSELEVYGKGGLTARPHAEPKAAGNHQYLSGGDWKLQRASEVNANGEEISKPDFGVKNWVVATVPGTVLSSYINIGAVPNPNYADNILTISESFFYSNFWYRNEFTLPADFYDDNIFLHFDGINWKANVFLNGQKIGNVDGGFMRGKFNITGLLTTGKNVLAVEIVKNAHQGAVKEPTAFSHDQNGGIPGADNPTFHATIGWDWIPTVRGRDIGIWNDVFLTHTGSVTLENPFVRTELPLPDTTSAKVLVEVTLVNHSDKEVSGKLKGSFGEAEFEQAVTLASAETKVVNLDPATHPALALQNPKLWWPVGYGEPYLYDVKLSFEANGKTSDATQFKSGVRQMTFSEDSYEPSGPKTPFGEKEPKRLSLYINGRRFIGFGGNWGFGESNLNYRGREYDIAVAYHADMNFTMIRNWVGQIGDEEFYEACDRHGVMVWQDFWLANPWDGPDPYYVDLFNDNAQDYIKRIRNHPSIGIYVGRNEGNPPAVIDDYLRKVIPQLHPGIHYISNSAGGVVSGGGPYRALPAKEYFQTYGHDKFHSERGMPNVMNYESMAQTFSPEALAIQNTTETPNSQWGMHDYTLNSAQGAASFNGIIEKAFGKPHDTKQFAEWAQWINYDGYRAIFEGRSEHRRGMLLWMSHPAWPSMVWQTYDYYFDPTGGYFGSKKGSEPIHIQYNPVREDIEVVNYHALDHKGVVAKAQLVNQDGSVQWEKETTLDIKEDATVACFPLELPASLSDTYFIKLTLTENGKLLSDNFYWRGKEEGNYQSLLQLPKTKLTATTTANKSGKEWHLTTTLKNDTQIPALMVRLKVEGEKSAERILPVFFSDNYIFLMPGEEKIITMKLYDHDTRGEKPVVNVSGFNL
ncbi:hypothetical protein FACS189440_09170 [Bacteroidia bacterium]|nr:hypothetical protein FACS189440_09170 [Bacteroidia bacterium]